MPRSRLVALAPLLLGLLGGMLSIRTPAQASGEPGEHGGQDRVVVIGVPGLRWGDVKPRTTPVLWRFAGEGAIANIAVRGVAPHSCPADGWLTISAGGRAQPVDDGRTQPGDDGCATLPRPRQKGAGAIVPGFAELRAFNGTTTYAAQVGLLGDVVHRAGGCTSAVGRGGALAVADLTGRVDRYRRSVAATPARDWSRCPITAVDIDDIAHTPDDRPAALARADRQIGTVLHRVPQNATIIVIGVADIREPGLRVAVTVRRGDVGSARVPGVPGVPASPAGTPASGSAGGPADGFHGGSPAGTPGVAAASAQPGTYLTAPSTRTSGLVTLTDVTPTVLRLAGLPVPVELTGTPWQRGAPRPARQSAAVEALRDRDLAARITRALVAPFNIALVAGQLVMYGLAALAWRRRIGRRLVRAVTRWVALAAAAAPAATYLANLVPWWSVRHPSVGLVAAVVAADLAVLGLAMTGPWRRRPLGPVTAVAAVTALALATDAIAGSPLQADSLNGNFSLVAGRFYGFGNLTFALFATASLICAAVLAGPSLAAGRHRRAVLPVLVIGSAAIVIDGWPGWGSDFGGVLALTPGVVLLAMWIAGLRVSPRRVLIAGGAGVAIVSGLAYLDYLRPADQRTHLGDFCQRLLDGQATAVIARKADSMLHSLGSVWLTVLVPLPLLVLAFLLLRADGRLAPLFRQVPSLRAGLLATLITAIIGFAVNDSGIAVLALAALIAVPLTLAAVLSIADARPVGATEPVIADQSA